MRKIREAVRMHRDLGLSQREIGQATVHDYLRRWEASGLGWPLEAGLSDAHLEGKLFGGTVKAVKPSAKPLPDFARIQEELRANKSVSLQLLCEEYREAHPGSHYSYVSFWRYYDQWRDSQDVVMRQEHVLGEKLFVDWAGPKLTWHDPKTGIAQAASLFVAVLGPVTILTPRRRWIRRWSVGCGRTSTPWSSSGERRGSSCRTTRERQSPQAAVIRLRSIRVTWRWQDNTELAWCRRVRTNRATRPRWRWACRLPSDGSWPRCGIGASILWES